MKTHVLRASLIAAIALHVCTPETFAQSSIGIVKIEPLREAYYGDLHLHTSYSLDAYFLGTLSVGPDEAYRFAKGEVVTYLGEPLQRREPLDFLAVTDHSENIGVFNGLEEPSSAVSQSETGKALKSLQSVIAESQRNPKTDPFEVPSFRDQYRSFWSEFFFGSKNKLPEDLKTESVAAWARVIDFANRNYQPGKFTTFIAYEWSATPYGANLHRNVIFKGDSAPYPFTSFDSKVPEDLWTWLETIRTSGYEALAIPHNSNASDGLMYGWVDSNLNLTRAYATKRQANEPLSEIAQNKGASETHPLLSPNDEFADFEIYDFTASWRHQESRPQGSYLRDALSRGLLLQRQLGVNPYKYGFVGASDLHSGLSVSAQADYGGSNIGLNMAVGRPTKAQAAHVLGDPNGLRMRLTTSGNLTGVWAESNTRESIYEALRRRETFATSGTKLKFRFFGGWKLSERVLQKKDWVATAYARGVPMGGDLPERPKAVATPSFIIWAAKDPNGGNLDRVQVIKVWEEEGKQMEKVFDVVWSGSRKLDPKTGRLPHVGDTVDRKTGHFTNDIGAAELKAVWNDPEFNPHHLAAYYLRVLEIPTPRWSTLLAIQAGLPLPEDVPPIAQQRGWSSPIWYTP